MRGRHQCLVTEIFFPPDATDPGETPGSSDNLSQRNLAILFSDNPGDPESHTVMHTFEIKPSALPKLPPDVAVEAVPVRAPRYTGPLTHLDHSGQRPRRLPDELLFRWWNMPAQSEVTVYFGDISTDEIMRLAGLRLSPVPFTQVDDHTLRLDVAGTTWVPLPGGRSLHIPALLTVRLPDDVTSGATYRMSVHQVDGGSGRVIGAFELTIPVSKAALILEDEIRTLSVMKHILSTIPPTNRWYPVFQLYVHGLAEKVDALGGDSGSVHGNPDGSGTPYRPPDHPERDRDLCALIACLLSERVISRDLEARLQKAGIDLDAVRKCVLAFCRSTRPADRPSPAAGAAFPQGGVAAAPPHEQHHDPEPPEERHGDAEPSDHKHHRGEAHAD